MKDRHVVIFTIPTLALCNPTMAIVSVLVLRGYLVTCVTSERFAHAMEARGAKVLRCACFEPPFDQTDCGMPIEEQYARGPIDLAERAFAATSKYFALHPPDLVIYDAMAFAGILLAQQAGVPAIRMSSQFAFTKDTLAADEVPAEWKEKEFRLNAAADNFLNGRGCTSEDAVLTDAVPSIYFYPNELQLAGFRPRCEVLYAPRCAAERMYGMSPLRIRRCGRPITLVCGSTTYQQDRDYYLKCAEAMSGSGWDVCIAATDQDDRGSLHPLPKHCRVLESVPVASVLSSVDLVVCSGGMATAMEAMYHGVPMLIVTQGQAELEAYASKYQNHEMGIHLRGKWTSEAMANSAHVLHHEASKTAAVRRMQRLVRSGPGGQGVANWLENFLEL
jgi:MGT family glycosyltransferase